MPSQRQHTRFVTRSDVAALLSGRSIAIVGSGPSAAASSPGLVDSHDVVLRVNNYKLSGAATGQRTDVFYSFFGRSIKKSAHELTRDGVQLCMCKCPDAQFIQSDWHRRHGKMAGVDFSYIYNMRRDWWFCDTYVPPVEDFLAHFYLLGRHVPTTGFAAILDVLGYAPRSVYLTGFDFFMSGKHNLNERWTRRNDDDPIGHVPDRERAWLAANRGAYNMTVDSELEGLLG